MHTRRPSLWLLLLLAAVFATACSSTDAAPPPQTGNTATLADTTKVLDDDTRAALASYGADGTLTFSRSTPLTDGIGPGTILASKTNPPVAPLGFLRTVTAVDRSGGQVVVHTGPAKLEQALKQANVSVTKTITKADVASFTPAGPGVSMPQEHDIKIQTIPSGQGLRIPISNFSIQYMAHGVMLQVTVNGSVTINPTFNASLDVEFDLTKGGPYVKQFMSYCEFDIDTDLTIDGELQLEGDLEQNLFTMTLDRKSVV